MQKLETLPPPPGVIGSLRAGFDAVSSHVVLILLPLALDLFLWLGPRLSVGKLYSSILSQWFELNKQAGFPVQNVDVVTERVEMLGRVNVLNWIRTLPIGIPSLLSGILPDTLPLKTPLGLQNVIQAPSILDHAWMAFNVDHGWLDRWRFVLPLGIGNHSGGERTGSRSCACDSADLPVIGDLGDQFYDHPCPSVVHLDAVSVLQSRAGERRGDTVPDCLILVGCAVVLYTAWDLCEKAECVPFHSQ
ncbi:MAG: hypothetical protein QM730_12010 [Anaerolineales bacterium]